MKNRFVVGLLNLPRTMLGLLLQRLPDKFITYIYTTILSPKPLRWVTNKLLTLLLPASIKMPEGNLYLNPHDPVVSGALALGVYEPYYTTLFRESLAHDMTVIDIGANLGFYTLLASPHVAQVISFEPEPENYALLEKNVTSNHLDNVTICQQALGDQAGTIELYFDPNNRGKHSLLANKQQSRITVTVGTLDDYVRTLGNPRISLIKLDIEGWEAKALKGMADTLRRYHPLIFFEFVPDRVVASGEDPLQTLKELTSMGYKLSLIDESRHQTTPITNLSTFISSHSGKDTFINLLATPKTGKTK